MNAVDYIMNGRSRSAGQYPYPLRISREWFFVLIIEKTFVAELFYHLLESQLKRPDAGRDKLIYNELIPAVGDIDINESRGKDRQSVFRSESDSSNIRLPHSAGQI